MEVNTNRLVYLVSSYLYESKVIDSTFRNAIISNIGSPNKTLQKKYIINNTIRKTKCVHTTYIYDWIIFIVLGREILINEKCKKQISQIDNDGYILIINDIDLLDPWERVLDEATKFGFDKSKIILLIVLQRYKNLVLTSNEAKKLPINIKNEYIDLGLQQIKQRKEEILELVRNKYIEFKAIINIRDINKSLENLRKLKDTLMVNIEKNESEIMKIDTLIHLLEELLDIQTKLKVGIYVHKALVNQLQNIYQQIFFHKERSNMVSYLIDYLRDKYNKKIEEETMFL